MPNQQNESETKNERNKRYTAEDIRYVYKNYSNMRATQIADTLGISRNQVFRIASQLRKHVNLPKKRRRDSSMLKFLQEEGITPNGNTVDTEV